MKICEAMETFPIFAGLTSLQVRDLKVRDSPVQDTDRVEEFQEEILFFDLKSSDIWLKIALDCFELPVSISFEFRTLKSSTLGTIKEALKYVANELLGPDNSISYHEDEIQILKDETELDSDRIVNEIFDYMDNCMYVRAKKATEIATRIIDRAIFEKSVIERVKNLGVDLPVRQFQVDNRKKSAKDRLSKRSNSPKKAFCVRCLIM